MSHHLDVAVEAIELRGPGLADWRSAAQVLAGLAPYCPAPLALQPPAQLAPAERRRAIASVRLALTVGAAAVAQAGLEPACLPAVFASSGIDGDTMHAILHALAQPAREVSPTRFHNAVHNAPSGYWGLAMQSREAVTSLSGYDQSFAAGLLEAAVQTVCDRRAVLLVAYDRPYPPPLDAVRPLRGDFGVAMVLSPTPSAGAQGRLLITWADGQETGCAEAALEALRRGNPAARALPLLATLAAGSPGLVRLDLRYGTLGIEVMPGSRSRCQGTPCQGTP